MKKYVLGFAFDTQREHIVLIEKQKPDWQKGKLNGVGGKIETIDDSIEAAMCREFYEETGVATEVADWTHYATMNFENDVMGGGAAVYVFKMFSDDVLQCSTCEEEVVEVIPMANLDFRDKMHNLHLLIPLALQKEFAFTDLYQKRPERSAVVSEL